MVTIAAQSGVINNVPDGKVLLGSPAIDASRGKRAYSMIQYLPDMRQSLRKLASKVEELTKQLEGSDEGAGDKDESEEKPQ